MSGRRDKRSSGEGQQDIPNAQRSNVREHTSRSDRRRQPTESWNTPRTQRDGAHDIRGFEVRSENVTVGNNTEQWGAAQQNIFNINIWPQDDRMEFLFKTARSVKGDPNAGVPARQTYFDDIVDAIFRQAGQFDLNKILHRKHRDNSVPPRGGSARPPTKGYRGQAQQHTGTSHTGDGARQDDETTLGQQPSTGSTKRNRREERRRQPAPDSQAEAGPSREGTDRRRKKKARRRNNGDQ